MMMRPACPSVALFHFASLLALRIPHCFSALPSTPFHRAPRATMPRTLFFLPPDPTVSRFFRLPPSPRSDPGLLPLQVLKIGFVEGVVHPEHVRIPHPLPLPSPPALPPLPPMAPYLLRLRCAQCVSALVTLFADEDASNRDVAAHLFHETLARKPHWITCGSIVTGIVGAFHLLRAIRRPAPTDSVAATAAGTGPPSGKEVPGETQEATPYGRYILVRLPLSPSPAVCPLLRLFLSPSPSSPRPSRTWVGIRSIPHQLCAQ